LLINHDSKNIAGKEEAEAYVEFEKFFASVMKQEKLLQTITKIKHSLERGVIPHSNIQLLLQKKREKKKAQRQASESENSNILDFIYGNLPADLEEVRNQAEKQTVDAKEQRETQKEERKQADKRKREEEQQARDKKAEEKKKKHKKDEHNNESEENMKKTITKTIKTTDDDGFTMIDKEFVRKGEGGDVERTVKASDKLKSDMEKEDQKSKKKNADEVGSDAALHNNPYAAVKRAGGLQSAQEIQNKANKQKGAQRNADNNVVQQEKGVKAPPPPKQKPKKSKPLKTSSKLGDSTSDSESSPQVVDVSSSVGVNPQPVLIGAFAIAVAVLSYVFLLS